MNELKCLKKSRNIPSEQVSDNVLQIRTDDIRANRAQPRSNFNQNSIIRLADSIRRYGILQPLSVRESDPEDSYKYELIAGERRLRAARMLGYLTVPCVVIETDEQTSAELAIIENLHREDLNMFEEAYGYKKLIEIHHLTQEEVARRMSSSQSSVANKLRLLRLSYEEQRFALENNLTERHVRACIRIDDSEARLALLREIAEKRLNVNDTEERVEAMISCKNEHSNEKKPQKCGDPDERGAYEVANSIRRRVDNWVRSGGCAEINVSNKSDFIELVIKIEK